MPCETKSVYLLLLDIICPVLSGEDHPKTLGLQLFASLEVVGDLPRQRIIHKDPEA